MATSFNIIHSMSYKRLLLLAFGVGCLFGIIGPLNILMLSPEKNPSWTAVFLMTFFSGATAFSILALFRRWYIGVPALVLFFFASFFVGSIEEFLSGSRTIETPWITIEIGDEIPAEPVTLTAEQLKALQRKRMYIGFLAINLLGIGYALVITAITQEGRDRARLATEISIAQNIQKSLLPPSPFTNAWCEVAGVTIPATEVGGDYFDIVELSKDLIAIAIADVSGHGVGAGMLAGMTKSAFRSQLGHNSSPSVVLENLNNTIFETSDRKTFVTFAFLLLERKKRSVHVATAGHPAILHANGSKVMEIRSPNIPLGVKKGQKFREQRGKFSKGDLFVLHTDGIVEAANKQGEEFGLNRLKELAFQSAGNRAPDAHSSILKAIQLFVSSKDLQDDATLVVVKT